jgi:hypothetical protein
VPPLDTTAPSLAAFQERFYRLLTAPVPVARALAAVGLDRVDVEAWFAGDERLDAVERLDLYANMYFFRIRDILRDLYPRLLAVVGDDTFHDLVTDYLLACPPGHPSITRAGERFPGFIAGHGVAHQRPWLAHLAVVEWAIVELHDGPDAVPLDLETLRAAPPDALGALRLCLVPCHARVTSTHAVDRLLAGEPTDPPATPTTIAVWRPALEVRRRSLSPLEAPLFELLACGTNVAGLCEAVAAQVGDQAAVAVAFECLRRWASEGHLLGSRDAVA